MSKYVEGEREVTNLIQITTGSTDEAEAFVDENLNKLGSIISIEHSRNRTDIEYQTTIIGANETLKIEGGLTSGYDGKGPNGLIRVLKLLGLDESTAVSLVKGNTEENHEFEHRF